MRSLLLRDQFVLLGMLFFLVFAVIGSAGIWYSTAPGPSDGGEAMPTAERVLLILPPAGFFSAVLAAILIMQSRAYEDLLRHGRVLDAEVLDFPLKKRGKQTMWNSPKPGIKVYYKLDGQEILARRLVRGHAVYNTMGLGSGARIKVLVHESKPDRFLLLRR